MSLSLLHTNIKSYLKKFYLFKVLRGLIFASALFLSLFLLGVTVNYFFFLPVLSKQILFFFFIALLVGSCIEFILFPLFKMFSIIPGIGNKTAAFAISERIPELKDILINILELESQSKVDKYVNIDLLNASLNQKINQISLFNFISAITFSDLKKYFKYLAFPIILLLLVLVIDKSFLEIGTKRFVNYSVFYEPKAPFNFTLLDNNLTVQSGSDLTVSVKIDGQYIPSNVYIAYGSNKVPMISDLKSKSVFNYTFKSINNSFPFEFEADGFSSTAFSVNVLPSPNILNFTLSVEPPTYTGKPAFSVENSGDVIVPYGSALNYSFLASNVDSLFIDFDSTVVNSVFKDNFFIASIRALKSVNYSISVKNKYFAQDLFKYSLTVVPDLYPNIKVDAVRDSNSRSLFYYRGLVADDYGFRNVSFNYVITDKFNENTESLDFNSIKLKINPNQLNQEFYFYFDFSDLELSSNQIVKYYFKVTDNDYISGFKSTSTSYFNYFIPSLQQLDSTFNSISEQVQNELNLANELSFEIQLDIDNFQKRMLNEDVSSWEKQDFIENLLKKQNNLQQALDSLKNKNEDKLNELKTFDPKNEELLKKHEEIQKLIDELMTDELKELLEELKKLQENFDDKKFDQNMEKTQFSYVQMSSELDRTKELLKRMELEQEMQSVINQLDELAEEQESLSKSFDKKNVSDAQKDSLLTNEFKFDELMQQYDSLMKKNEDLEKPYDLDDFNSDEQSIKEEMENAKNEMFDDKNKKASESIQKSAEDMKKMSQQMSSMMQQNSMQQNSEDMQTIKFLLSNLLSFSFTQEKINLITQKNFSSRSDAYISLKMNQLGLLGQFQVISDSLNSLAKRNPLIGKIITDQLLIINKNLFSSSSNLDANKRGQASIDQRNVITAVNKLALMLNEALNNMENQMSSTGGGSPQQSGKQPQPSVGDMQQMQQSMQQQLEGMIEQMKNGQKPGSQSMGQQVGEREAFQKMLEQIMNSGSITDEMKEMLQEINELNDEIRKDILNNNITPELIQRDNQIKTRLLEVQKSDNQRKFSEKRESHVGNDVQISSPKEIEKYFNDYRLMNESFSKKIIKLNPFYKTYYNGYVYRLGQE
ncbi:MAG: hypothetical protein JXL97_13110 [Bacteroidales bacterium]|nr:hypothetical protein [Bacteroidales bacterium]